MGRMVKAILEPFGYRVTTQKDLPKQWKGRYFSSASCYALSHGGLLQPVLWPLRPGLLTGKSFFLCGASRAGAERALCPDGGELRRNADHAQL